MYHAIALRRLYMNNMNTMTVTAECYDAPPEFQTATLAPDSRQMDREGPIAVAMAAIHPATPEELETDVSDQDIRELSLAGRTSMIASILCCAVTAIGCGVAVSGHPSCLPVC